MSEDDVLFGYRLRVFHYAARTNVGDGLPGVRDPPLDLLRLQAQSEAARARDPAPAPLKTRALTASLASRREMAAGQGGTPFPRDA